MLRSTKKRAGASGPPSGSERSTGNEDQIVPRGTIGEALSTPPTADLIRPSLETVAVLRGRPRAEALDCLALLVDLLVDWAAHINLTGHRSRLEVIQGILGRALGLSEILPSTGGIVDLGSGAGFPGLPLAILWPHRRLTLVESRARRHHFQLHAIRELALGNVRALHGRAEALEPDPQELAIAQAVGPPDAAVRLALPWVHPGGRIVIPGASSEPRCPAEIASSELTGYRLPHDGRSIPVWIGVRR